MKRLFTILVLFSVVLMNYSCEKDVQGTENDVRDMKICVTVSDVTSASARIVLEPELQDESYYYSAMPKAEFDALGGDEGVKKADMEYFQDMAEENGLGISQIISGLLISGNEDEVYNNLKPETEYVVYAYSMDKNGNSGSTVSKAQFTTEEDVQEPVGNMVEVEIKSVGMCEVSAEFIPQDGELMYFPSIIDEELYNEYGGDEDAIKEYFRETLEYTASKYDMTVQEAIQKLWICGKIEKDFKYLKPETEYYCYAVVLDADANILGLGYAKTETTDRIMTDLKLSYEISNIKSISFDVKVTPSDMEQPYFFELWEKTQFDAYETDEEVMQAALDRYGENIEEALYKGELSGPFDDLPPATDFVLVGFGYNGSFCTELFKQEVSTPEILKPEDFTADFELVELTDVSATFNIFPADPAVFFHFHYMTKEFAESYASLEDAVQADFRNYVALWKETSPELTDEQVIEKIGRYGSRVYQTGLLSPDTDYYMWAASFDKSGKLVSKASVSEFKTNTYTVNENVEVVPVMGKYFDGDALADDLGMFRFRGLMVAVVDTIKVSNTKTWYTLFFKGDLSSSEEYPDHLLAANLKKKGLRNKGDRPFESYMNACGKWTLSAVGVDEDGHFGPVFRQVIDITKDGAAGTDEYPAGGYMPSPENKADETVIMCEQERFGIDMNYTESCNRASSSFTFVNTADDKALKPIKKSHNARYSNRIR